MIPIYHVRGPYDDPYEYITLDDPRPIESFESLDILEIKSIYHFFECFDTQEPPENMQEVFKEILNEYLKFEILAI